MDLLDQIQNSMPLEKNYYQILELTTSASNQDIKKAYYRLKKTYQSDSQAMYSLLESEDLSDSIDEIELAFKVLANPGSKKEYDLELEKEGSGQLASDSNSQEIEESDPFAMLKSSFIENSPLQEGRQHDSHCDGLSSSNSFTTINAKPLFASQAKDKDIKDQTSEILSSEQGDIGHIFSQLRGAVGVSKSEMQEQIKISEATIINIEENNFDLLPQPVYVKGFLKNYLRFLGIDPANQIVCKYIESYKKWMEKKIK